MATSDVPDAPQEYGLPPLDQGREYDDAWLTSTARRINLGKIFPCRERGGQTPREGRAGELHAGAAPRGLRPHSNFPLYS